MKINIYIPSIAIHPTGGVKIMYEYANRLAQKGHDVLVYNIYTNEFWLYRFPHWLRTIKNDILHRNFRPSWYDLDEKVKCLNIPRLKEKYVRDASISLSTNWALAFPLNELSRQKGKKINLIQGYELWIGNNKEMLHASYRLPIIHVVIADYLADILEKENGIRPPIVYNAIDEIIFNLKTPIETRNPYTISMLFSILEEVKGTQYGLEALRICKKEVPDLRVELFGVHPKPQKIEKWMHYTQKPQNLCALYNSTSIYFTPSNTEGWALPPAEAMTCGCALVCTDIGGHGAYAKKDETALMVKPKDTQDMAEKLLILLKNNEKRISLAKRGNEFIQQFCWEKSIEKIEQLF